MQSPNYSAVKFMLSLSSSYVHDGGGANLVLTKRSLYQPLCFFVEAKELSITLMNKNISKVVVRGIVLIISNLLSTRVE